MAGLHSYRRPFLRQAQALYYITGIAGILQSGELKRLGTLEDLYRSVPKTYRLVYDGVSETAEHAGNKRIVYDAAEFESVKKIIEEKGLTEYSVRRISLEDVYLELIGGERQRNGS